MTDRDPAISAVLDRLIPEAHEPRDWQQLLARAGTHTAGRRRTLPLKRRLLFAAVLVVLAVLVPLTALAVGRGWWFLSAYGPKPVGNVVVVTSGTWRGTPWNLTAFRTDKGTICYALTVEPATPQPLGSAEACGPVTAKTPISFLRSLGTRRLLLTRGRFSLRGRHPHSFPAYIVGVTTDSITTVTITGTRGTQQNVSTIPAPAPLHASVRVFVAERQAAADISSITGRDASGSVVARMRVQGPPEHYRLAGPGKPLPLTAAAIHELRLHHRSPHIYLLASRDRQNFYRLGTSGRCYGTGRSDHLSWSPPKNVMRILGVIECGGQKGPALELGAPVLDLSIYGQTRGQKLMTVYTLAGIASSTIVAVELVNADGVSVQRVPVRNGVYADRPLPQGIVAIAPENSSGVWLSGCGFGKNSLPILLMRC
jgi:hypothetical protein